MPDLICEGQCNAGDVQRYDAAARTVNQGPIRAALSSEMLRLGRQLVYTPHRESGTRFWQCEVCKAERRWG